MAEFLRTTGISHQIEEIIINSKEKLIIVSPYLKLTENLIERLKEKDLEKIEIIFIYGKSELSDREKRKLYSLPNLSLYYYKNLHAKCYFNESKMLITSMNLYEFSEKNNREMGILIDKTYDSSIYENAKQESFSILKAAILEKKAVLQTQNLYSITIEDFIFKEEGNITKWLEKVLMLLSSKFKPPTTSMEFNQPIIECPSLMVDNLTLKMEATSRHLRIIFQFSGKKKKELFFKVQTNGRDTLENILPEEIIGWGNQMMRIKLDFSQGKFPNLLKYDKNSILQIVDYISKSEQAINQILNFKVSELNSLNRM